MRGTRFVRVCVVFSGLSLTVGGCVDPLARETTAALRDQILQSQRSQSQAIGQATVQTTTDAPKDSYLSDPQRAEQLDAISGPSLYRDKTPDLDVGLDGKPATTVALSLGQAIRTAVKNNLDIKIASMQPAISEAELAAAEAAFDAIFFTNFNWNKEDRPQQATTLGAVGVGTQQHTADSSQLATGIRKPLETGGTITASTGFDYNKNKTPGLSLTPDPGWITNVRLGIEQPLLRNFGAATNRARIAISRNALRREALGLNAQMLNTVSNVEDAYWQLVLARSTLAVQEELLRKTLETRDLLVKREQFDVTAVQKSQAQSFVENRRAEVITDRQRVREASDRLKKLLNDPSLPLSGETLIVPIDLPVEVPVSFNMLDAVTAAQQKRPELLDAWLGIDDASIRVKVAQNQKLPVLNLNAAAQFNGINRSGSGIGAEPEGGLGNSYGNMTDGDYIEYVVGVQFEAPLGNREAGAFLRSTRLRKQSAVYEYQKALQEVIQSVKSALRQQQAQYQLIGVARDERRAAAEHLRALEEREKNIEGLTPEFLDLKLRAQQARASAELREYQAMADYNIALMRVQLAMGTLLEHNQIDLAWPDGMFADK